MFSGTIRVLLLCQPAPSSTSTAWTPGATVRESRQDGGSSRQC